MKNCRFPILAAMILFTAFSVPRFTPAAPGGGDSPEIDRAARIEEWLVLGPVATPFPAFSDENTGDGKSSFLLSYDFIPDREIFPENSAEIEFPASGTYSWNRKKSESEGIILEEKPSFPMTAYLASYIEVSSWAQLEFWARSNYPFQLTVDGNSIIRNPAEGSEEYHNGKAKLKRGKHRIIVKTVAEPGDSAMPWMFEAMVNTDDAFGRKTLLSTEPERGLNIHDILDCPTVEDIQISSTGDLAALAIEMRLEPDGEKATVVEIRETGGGDLIRTIVAGEDMGGFQWRPGREALSYTLRDDKKTTVRTMDLSSGEDRAVVKDIERFGGYSWSQDGEFIIYSATRKNEDTEEGYKRLRGLYDRTGYGRRRSDLYIASVKDPATRKLTTGEHSSHLAEIHPGGEKILLTRRYEDLSKRPYGKTELVILDLKSGGTETIWKGRWFSGACWSPKGKRILVAAGPSAFGDIGVNLPEGTVPNDYDTQLYLFNPETGGVEAITRNFAPAVRRSFWPRSGGGIYIVAEDGPFVKLFRYDTGAGRFDEIRTSCDVIGPVGIPDDGQVSVLAGTSTGTPQKLFRMNLKNQDEIELPHPSGDWFEHIRKTRVEEWNFTASSGREIVGRIHYPPGFDKDKSYPCIVYYYGGTSPVSRDFGGRYPKNLWASMGYVVYVLQPSGATGFGQGFSSKHVNDWGETVSREIIEGTGKFLKAHPFVDSERVGCIGASFGGFMTQLLVTRTDIFAAAVSHAGISSISSYWGEGYWGYSYNAVSAANSFPWNRPDIYVDRSPLFAADRVTTPLLLLHGAGDTNVPPGESEQMYTALKLLGKEVEYIKFEGQNHFILEYSKRIKWSDAQLAWFDRWLKDQPQWWNDMFPPLDNEGGSETGAADPAEMSARVIEDEKYGTFLAGEITPSDIKDALPEWDSEYYSYQQDMEVVVELMEPLSETEIICVLGTWCGDSERMVPRLWKVLESAQFDISGLRMLAITSSGAEPGGGTPEEVIEWSGAVSEFYGIEAVPTIIVKRNGQEIGRIIETATESVETDLLKILER